MLRLAVALILTVWGGMVWAGGSGVDRLAQALRLNEVVEILRAEGLDHADALDADMLGRSGGAYFADQVAILFDADDMLAALTLALAEHMTGAQIADSTAYFESATGRRIIALELSARAAFSDKDVEAVAIEHYKGLAKDDPLRGLVRTYVEANDLVPRNVDGIQSTDYSFYRGLVEGGAYDADDETYIALLLEERETLMRETEDWAMSFHLLAYDPLTTAEHEANIAYSRSPAGQAFNDAIFAGFDGMYEDIFYRLGRLIAQAMSASDL